jgi:hypothetical protein
LHGSFTWAIVPSTFLPSGLNSFPHRSLRTLASIIDRPLCWRADLAEEGSEAKAGISDRVDAAGSRHSQGQERREGVSGSTGARDRSSGTPTFYLKRRLVEHAGSADFGYHAWRHTIAMFLENAGYSEWERALVLNPAHWDSCRLFTRTCPRSERSLFDKWAKHVEQLVQPEGAAVVRWSGKILIGPIIRPQLGRSAKQRRKRIEDAPPIGTLPNGDIEYILPSQLGPVTHICDLNDYDHLL